VPAVARTTTTEVGAPAAVAVRAARAHAARAAMFERAASRVVALDWGSALFHDRLPRHPDLNTVRVEVPAPELDAERLHGAVERLQARLAHRRVEVFDEGTARALEPGMLALGYAPGHSVLMGCERSGDEREARGRGDDPPVAPAVEEVPYGIVESLRREWLTADWAGRGPDAVEQGVEGDRLIFAATPTRAFASFDRGRPVAYGLLLDFGPAALVEDVYTTPDARGGGLGGAVVHRLVWESRHGGHEDTVLATPVDGRARELYRRLGFAELATVHRFLRWDG
jgi:GNAT superfamily N-acetyltransferase